MRSSPAGSVARPETYYHRLGTCETIQLSATFFIAAGTAPFFRGEFALIQVLFLPGGIMLGVLLVSRIVRREYVISLAAPTVHLLVNTVSVPYFVFDLGWLTFGAVWLYDSLTAVPVPGVTPDHAFSIGGPSIVLLTAVPLSCLRVWTRLHHR